MTEVQVFEDGGNITVNFTGEDGDLHTSFLLSRRDADDLRGQLDATLSGQTGRGDLTTIERYARLTKWERTNNLQQRDIRAVAIFTYWDQLAWDVEGRPGVTTERNSTQKNVPSRFKLELENTLGEQLEWMQIYRAMQQVAKLSGGSVQVDDDNLTHITGGAFEFHERQKPGCKQTYKELILTDRDSLNSLGQSARSGGAAHV